jgi:hypothetical protein
LKFLELLSKQLTGTTVNSDCRKINIANVLHGFRKAGRVEDSLGDSESDTIERLRDGQFKLGATRYEHWACSQKRLVNQIGTGIVSRHTPLNILERRSEHLWTRPLCKDDNLLTNH